MKTTTKNLDVDNYFCLFSYTVANAQTPKLTTDQQQQLKELSLTDFTSFKKSAQPLVKEIGLKKIVGMGEATHGTAEFYKMRYWLTRMLIEDYGYNHVAFENDMAETWLLNDELAKTKDLNGLMKKYLISLWQNEETKELLTWVKEHNRKSAKKVTIHGIDFPSQKPDVVMLKTLLTRAKDTSFDATLSKLATIANLQDEAWAGMNMKGYKLDWKLLGSEVKKGYIIADSVEKIFQKRTFKGNLKTDLLLAIGNLKQGFEPFYKEQPAIARDSIMAYNTSLIVKNPDDKLVIWAHNGHLGKTGIYDNAVGGTGGFILKLFPNQYFALGTATAIGTFGGTTDARAINTSVINSYKLEEPIKGSWEELWSTATAPNFYLHTKAFNPTAEIKPLRFVGYGIKSGKSSYDAANLSDLYDVVIFLKETKAPTALK